MRLATTPGSLPTILKPTTLRFDRRTFPRTPQQTSAMAAFYDEDGAVCLTRVEIADSSLTGLGVRASQELAPGLRVSIYHPTLPVALRTGRVVYCEPVVDATAGEHGDDAEAGPTLFRLGIRGDSMSSAA